ncbi:MAG: hypothetical protein JSR17_08765 [Proteobacteria bacterium]|nr:hypothetical protein [Pseudomonadota bacterium]
MFNVLIALFIALIAALPLFWMKTKASRTIGALVALGIGAVGFGVSKTYLYPEYLGWQFEHEIKKQALFTLISQNYPAEFKEYVKKVKQNLRTNDDPNLVSAYSTQLVNNIFYKSLANTPDDYVGLYLKSTIDLYRYLNGQDPRAVIKLENGDNAIEYDIGALYETKDFQKRLNHLLDTKRYVIEAAIKNPTPPPQATQAEPLLKGVMSELAQKYGDNAVRAAFTAPKTIPPNVGAQIIIEFYTSILSAGPENAGIIMRYIASLKGQPNHPAQKDAPSK